MVGTVLSLWLTATASACEFQGQDQPAPDSSPTLLSAPAAAAAPAPAAAPKTSDPAASRSSFQSTASPDLVSSRTEEPFPSIEPLPLAQARPNQAQAPRRGQPQPAPATPGARAAVPARPAQPRPAAAGVQQQQEIQFDPSGLVTHFHVNEGDLRQILELLSRRAGLNILVSPKVSGTVTVNFEGVTVERVLEAVIKLANLVQKTEGSIHFIYTKQELQDEAEEVKKERILTKIYKLNYVRADELLGIIRPFLSPDVGQRRISITPSYRFGISESATFVSGGGAAMSAGGGGGGGASGPGGGPTGGGGSGPVIGGFQPPTGANSMSDSDHLIVQDYESNLKIIDQIIQRIDVRPVQVLIEAVIVSVDLEHDKELGINFAVVDNLANMLGTVGTGTALNGNVGFNPTQLLTAAGKLAQGAIPDAQGFTSATNGIKFGFVANNVTGFVRKSSETVGSTKILASPRILVLNKQRAEIQLGMRLGFQTLSQNFTSTIQQVQFLNTGTLLRLRPFVSNDGMVRMEIHPERSSGSVTNNIPNQQTAELTTNVMVPDGATLVIGGLMEDEDDFQFQGLPGLSRLPLLGMVFGNRQKTEGRRELVVLLTPHIWSVDQAMANMPAPNGAAGVQRNPTEAFSSATVEYSGPTPASTPASTAASTPPLTAAAVPAGVNPPASGSNAQGVTRSEPAPSGTPPNQQQQASSPPKQGPRQFFSRLFSRRAPDQGQAQPSASSTTPAPSQSHPANRQPARRCRAGL